MIIPIIGPGNRESSSESNADRTYINLYPELSQDSKHIIKLLPSPGLKVFASISGSKGRGVFVHKDTIYTVIDNTLYSVDVAGNSTSLGTLNTSSDPVSFAATNDQIALVDGTDGYLYTISTSTFSTITSSNFPQGPETITAHDGYFLISPKSGQRINFSNLRDGSTWDALDVFSAERSYDDLIAVKSFSGFVWAIGRNTTELWFNTGRSFPWERVNGLNIEQGIAARYSLAEGAAGLYWLAQSANGMPQVVRTNGTSVEIISDNTIGYQFSQLSNINDASGFTYQLYGVEFYALNFTTDNKTYVFDTSTGLWHRRDTYTANGFTRHLAESHGFFGTKNIVGGYNTGNLYELDPDTFTDNSGIIRRLMKSNIVNSDNNQMTIYNLQLDIEKSVGLESGQGSSPKMGLRVSRDGGHNYGELMLRDAGTIGEHKSRVLWSRLGTAREFVLELTATDPVRWVLLGAYADVEVGQ